jgi:hypothetical protein
VEGAGGASSLPMKVCLIKTGVTLKNYHQKRIENGIFIENKKVFKDILRGIFDLNKKYFALRYY